MTLEPWRTKTFPPVQDLMVDRSAPDRLITDGGYCSTGTGQASDANAQTIGQRQAPKVFVTATYIHCSACITSCQNDSASPFVSASLEHLGQLPQGKPERAKGVNAMQEGMEQDGSRKCSSNLKCEIVCTIERWQIGPAACKRNSKIL